MCESNRPGLHASHMTINHPRRELPIDFRIRLFKSRSFCDRIGILNHTEIFNAIPLSQRPDRIKSCLNPNFGESFFQLTGSLMGMNSGFA